MESHMKWISCQFCKFKLHQSDAMQQHIMTEHRDVSSQLKASNAYTSEGLAEVHFRCFLWTDTPEFLDRHALNIHMESHMKSITCHFCNYKGSSIAAVQQHILRRHRDVSLQCQASNACTSEGLGEIESVDNDLRCLLCSDTPEFLDKSALKIHMESHMKWISCHFYKYKSHNSESMKQHVIRKHRKVSLQHQAANACTSGGLAEVESVNNNVSCHVCKEDFPDRDALKIHMQLHGLVT